MLIYDFVFYDQFLGPVPTTLWKTMIYNAPWMFWRMSKHCRNINEKNGNWPGKVNLLIVEAVCHLIQPHFFLCSRHSRMMTINAKRLFTMTLESVDDAEVDGSMDAAEEFQLIDGGGEVVDDMLRMRNTKDGGWS